MPAQPLDSEEIRLLMEVGMVLAGGGRAAPAFRIFDALEQLRPTRAFPYVGRAMTLLNAGQTEEACRALRRALSRVDDETPTIQAFLGLALHLAGRSAESRRMLEEAARADPVVDGVRLARRMLGLDVSSEDSQKRFVSPLPGI